LKSVEECLQSEIKRAEQDSISNDEVCFRLGFKQKRGFVRICKYFKQSKGFWESIRKDPALKGCNRKDMLKRLAEFIPTHLRQQEELTD
jgi:hypothetical protein